ncbi:g13383 [Coccomyxa viridis]|uniref:G13383 protein n=1 Tax=Coccomyxa viridis TaxID=1274662 RepID=A0ABP1GCM2_9CHLO
MAYIERLTLLTSTKTLRREDYLNLVSIVRAHGLHESPRVSLAALSLLDHMSKVEQPVKMAQGTDGPTLHIDLSCWLPLSWEKKEHRGEKQRESQIWSEAQEYNVERKGPALPSGDILRCLVTALHAVNARPAESNGAHGDVLLLRHVVRLLALDLRLRIRVFHLRGPDCKARVKLLYSSILWSLYAEAPADTRKGIIKILAEIIGHVTESCEVGGNTASIPTVAYACGPAECAGLAQQLLTLILELLGSSEEAQLFNTQYVSRAMGNLRAEVDDLLYRLLTGHLKDEPGHESKLRSLDQKAALLSALQPADRLRTLGMVVAKKRVNTRTWECCKRMNEVLQQLEHEARKVQGFLCFSTLDVLDYLHREAAQPNDHDQRIFVGNTGLSSADGLALLLCLITGAEMEGEGALAGGAHDGQAAALKSTASAVMEALICGHNTTQKGRSTLLQGSVTFFDALLESTGLKDTLRNGDGNYTILAPHNGAWSQALIQNTLDCTTDFYITSECNDIQNLLTATNLKDILLSHIVRGRLDTTALASFARLQLMNGAVQPVMATPDGTLIVGPARVAVPNLPATNGVVHIIGSVLSPDASTNSSGVAIAERMGDFGPFNRTKREQMFTYEITFLPTSLPSLPSSYRRVRMVVGYPDGGVNNPMALSFVPRAGLEAGKVTSKLPISATSQGSWLQQPQQPPASRPTSDVDLCFMTIADLGHLLRIKLITSVELTRIFLTRLKKLDQYLEYVVTYTDDTAYIQAARADHLFSEGVDLGPLQGIPYGLKDLISVKGYRTTWGAPAYTEQMLDTDAYVYKRLQKAGAVLIAKLATGEMAFDDVWWGGKVKNPWNVNEGSSGSSAGPAAAVVAGAVAFALGTETEGSLMAPAERVGATGMRPSFGVIGRSGVMTLVDTLDKVGPFCRAASDCALILDAIRGRDTDDIASLDVALDNPFTVNISNLTLGVLSSVQDRASEFTAIMASRGVKVVPFELNYTTPANDIILAVMASEAAANFDYWQRSHRDDTNRRQDFWPPLLRLARMIPAVEYIQAQRARTALLQEVVGLMAEAGIDAFIGNTSEELAMANLASLPTIAVPLGTQPLKDAPDSPRKRPISLGIFGSPQTDTNVLALAMAFQNSTRHHLQQPPVNNVEPSILAKCMPQSRCTLPQSVLAKLPLQGNASSPSPSPSAPSVKAASSG